MMPAEQPVPIDPEVLRTLREFAGPPLTEEALRASRTEPPMFELPSLEQLAGDLPIEWEDRVIPGTAGGPDLEITIIRPRELNGPVPGLYNIHGGGMILGTRAMDAPRLLELVAEFGVVAVNVEYRLAPEHPYPAGVEDIYAGLEWTAAHAAELSIDPERIVVMGGSAGGGFSAAVSLLARDRRGPDLAGQLLLCPMLDNTNTTVSARQYAQPALAAWPRENNLLAWRMVLGERLAGSPEAPAFAAPARATDVSGLPPAFVEVGSAEMFRDEDVEYASRIWAAGGAAELHVWAGAFHGFDVFAPDSELARAAKASRSSWLRRVLGL
jgi:acetyl esterase/lipase